MGYFQSVCGFIRYLFPLGPSYDASLVVIGGRTGDNPVREANTTDIYYINSVTGDLVWSHYGREAPYEWSGAGVVITGNDIIVIGGHVGGYIRTRFAARYKTDLDVWETLPSMTVITWKLETAFVIGNKLYLTQGNLGARAQSMQSLDFTNSNADWQLEGPKVPFDLIYAKAVVIDEVVYICCGFDIPDRNRFITWKPGQMQFTSLQNTTFARGANSKCLVTDKKDKIWLLGSCQDEVCRQQGFIEEYSIASNTWTVLGRRNGNANSIDSCAYLEGAIYVTYNWNNEIHIFDTRTAQWRTLETVRNTAAIYSMAAIIPQVLRRV